MKNTKIKFYNILLGILIIAAIITIVLIIIKYGNDVKIENQGKQFVNSLQSQIISGNIQTELQYKGFDVIGIVKIPKIGLQYPILSVNTTNSMKISIGRYWGGNVNDYGNLSIAGHNNKSGTMFGKTKYLEIGDVVELTDLQNKTIQYKIYEKFITDPNDVTILETKDDTIREVTLITCTNGNRQRLIIKAKEILN